MSKVQTADLYIKVLLYLCDYGIWPPSCAHSVSYYGLFILECQSWVVTNCHQVAHKPDILILWPLKKRKLILYSLQKSKVRERESQRGRNWGWCCGAVHSLSCHHIPGLRAAWRTCCSTPWQLPALAPGRAGLEPLSTWEVWIEEHGLGCSLPRP